MMRKVGYGISIIGGLMFLGLIGCNEKEAHPLVIEKKVDGLKLILKVDCKGEHGEKCLLEFTIKNEGAKAITIESPQYDIEVWSGTYWYNTVAKKRVNAKEELLWSWMDVKKRSYPRSIRLKPGKSKRLIKTTWRAEIPVAGEVSGILTFFSEGKEHRYQVDSGYAISVSWPL